MNVMENVTINLDAQRTVTHEDYNINIHLHFHQEELNTTLF